MATSVDESYCRATVVTVLVIVLPLIYIFLVKMKRQKLFPEIPMVESSDERNISTIHKINPPKMNGRMLAITCWCVKHIWIVRHLVSKEIPRQLKFDKFLERRIADSIRFMPHEDYPNDRLPPSLHDDPADCREEDENDISWLENLVDEKVHVNDRATCLHYHKAYKDGTTTPSEVAEIVIENMRKLAEHKTHLNIMTQYNPQDIREQAAASTERYKSGTPYSLMDGVPIAIKDFLKVAGYRLTHGTTFENVEKKCDSDSNEVTRLKRTGAVIIGISSAHECGLGATGAAVNRVNKACRNAVNVNYMAGGSSGGSAAAVGSGLCPVAIGSDGGGSIRIPSSFNGLVGLKPTFNRIFNEPMRATLTVSGPLCWTTPDALLAYHYLNGPSVTHTHLETQFYPPKSVFRQDFPSLFQQGQLPKGFKIGIDRKYIKQALDPKVADCCLNMADMLKEQKDVELVEISIPELFESFVAFVIIFSAEGGFYSFWGQLDHFQDEFSPNLVMQAAFTNSLTANQYLLACQQKSRTCKFMRELFNKVDVIMLPTTGSRALELLPGDLDYGRLDTGGDQEIARYTWLANLTGLPSITVPLFWDTLTGKEAAKDVEMPCAVQLMASWWREDNSFLASRAVEKLRDDLIEEQETKQQKKKARVDYMLNVNSLPR